MILPFTGSRHPLADSGAGSFGRYRGKGEGVSLGARMSPDRVGEALADQGVGEEDGGLRRAGSLTTPKLTSAQNTG